MNYIKIYCVILVAVVASLVTGCQQKNAISNEERINPDKSPILRQMQTAPPVASDSTDTDRKTKAIDTIKATDIPVISLKKVLPTPEEITPKLTPRDGVHKVNQTISPKTTATQKPVPSSESIVFKSGNIASTKEKDKLLNDLETELDGIFKQIDSIEELKDNEFN